tara:strand:+ start:254 stop:508 length:255 start_codon:yes stop_codon:yes gene_type:complete
VFDQRKSNYLIVKFFAHCAESLDITSTPFSKMKVCPNNNCSSLKTIDKHLTSKDLSRDLSLLRGEFNDEGVIDSGFCQKFQLVI